MQKVSKEYKASMKDSLRERAYIMISFGVVNQEAQAKARVDSGEFAYFSNPDNLFNEGTDDVVYATLEENFTRVDGSMYFLPRNKPGAMFYNTGLVGKNLVSDGLYEVTINLHAAPTDFRGITINFGENYPTDFDFVTNTGQKVEFRDNDKAVFTTEEVLENVTTLTLVIHKMKNLRSRLRMNEVQAYGSVAWGAHDGNGYNVASGDGQFPLFMFDRTKLHNREDYWLRDVASATDFSLVSSYGGAANYGASGSRGVRPAFCIG